MIVNYELASVLPLSDCVDGGRAEPGESIDLKIILLASDTINCMCNKIEMSLVNKSTLKLM